ncbi:MAG: hypothetical protein KGR26_08285, partial [Cyanobacteria bacterium REEB65]|nr:hypothetical protein [Cyanobacteria bacterium REEB65]
MGRRFSAEEQDRICAEYQSGTDAVVLAEKYGMTSTSVYNWLKARGIERRHDYRLFTKDIYESAVSLYAQGDSCPVIAKKLGMGIETVRVALIRAGVDRDGPGKRYRDRETVIQDFWAQVDKDGPIPSHRPDLGPCWIWTRNKSY